MKSMFWLAAVTAALFFSEASTLGRKNPEMQGLVANWGRDRRTEKSVGVTAGAASPQSEAEAKIRRLENEWVQLAVHNDGAGYGRLLADEFIVIRTDGIVKTKADRIKAFSSGSIQTEVLELSDMQVRTYGNVAVVTGLATRKDTIDGKARDFQYRYTRVWTLRDDRWQCVLMQSTAIGPLGGLSK